MKLIYISNARIPTEKAHGIHIMKMCEAFAVFEGFTKSLNILRDLRNPSNTEVELVIPRRFNKIKDDPFKYYGVEMNFKIKKLPCIDLIPWDRYFGYFALWLESLSFTFSVFFYLLFKKADIIYTRDKSLLLISPFWKNFIFETHTFPKNYFLYHYFLKGLKSIVVITQKLKDLLMKNGVGENKILVAPDGVDIGMFDIQLSASDARKKLGLPLDKKIALYTGHLYKWKGAQTLAEASQFLSEGTEAYLVGGTKDDIKKFKIKNLKATLRGVPAGSRKINIVGHRPHQEIPLWLKAADVLVLPNSGKEEISKAWTSPLKMFEYMAAKRPIAASDLPSIREILNEGNAVLVEPDNPEALARGIIKALEDKPLSDKISERAFLDVQQYTWLKRAEKILF